jgi:hypothetical protein
VTGSSADPARTVPGVFGHLVTRFSSQAEDIATEALAYVLQRSPAAAAAFEEYLQLAVPVPGQLHYQTQSGSDDGSVPDLSGTATDGSVPVLVEAKFWAGLTVNQPVTYLRRLPVGRASVLLFVVPSVRLGILWTEVLERTRRAEITPGTEQGTTEYRWADVGDGRRLAMTSWPAVLSHLIDRVTRAGDAGARSDLEQLLGLCRRMDGEGFVPLTDEELSGSLPTRLLQYTGLIDRAVDELVHSGRATRKSAEGTCWPPAPESNGGGVFSRFPGWSAFCASPRPAGRATGRHRSGCRSVIATSPPWLSCCTRWLQCAPNGTGSFLGSGSLTSPSTCRPGRNRTRWCGASSPRWTR